jgi:hypothetical protein
LGETEEAFSMAAGAWVVYHDAKERLMDGTYDLDADTFTCALMLATYTPDAGADTDWADISANVCTSTDYAQVNLTSVTWDETNGTVTFDCIDISFGTSVDITAKYAVIFDNTHVSDGLLCYSNLDTGGGSVTSTNGSFQITISASGIFTLA